MEAHGCTHSLSLGQLWEQQWQECCEISQYKLGNKGKRGRKIILIGTVQHFGTCACFLSRGRIKRSSSSETVCQPWSKVNKMSVFLTNTRTEIYIFFLKKPSLSAASPATAEGLPDIDGNFVVVCRNLATNCYFYMFVSVQVTKIRCMLIREL